MGNRASQISLIKRALTLGFLVFALFLPATAMASAPNLSKSYKADSSLPNGSLVSLDSTRKDYVVSSNPTNAARVIGLIASSSDSLLAVDASQSTVQVAIAGTAVALVSTLDGNIKSGDPIAVSPINGVGMKSRVGNYNVGIATSDFSTSSSGATKETIKDKSGNLTTVYVGYVSLQIVVGVNSGSVNQPQLSDLQKLVKNWTGHTISTTRIIIALVVSIATLVTLVMLTYGAIYATIISVGRNPLAKYAVFRTLSSVITLAAITAVVAAITLTLLLT